MFGADDNRDAGAGIPTHGGRPGFAQRLAEHGVDYVVVGGVAAILQGAPIATLDLDIVYPPDDNNLKRLMALLDEHEGRYRDSAGRHIRPTARRLRENRVNLLENRIGLLDAMQQIGDGWSYDEVLHRAESVRVAGTKVRVLDLAAVIESKKAAGRDQDKAMLPVLRRTLEMRRTDAE